MSVAAILPKQEGHNYSNADTSSRNEISMLPKGVQTYEGVSKSFRTESIMK